MTTFRSRVRALLVGAGVIALVVVGAGGTLAASTTPPVWACYNTTGQVAMSSVAQCRLAGGGQLVQINAAGVPGPTGATGPTGTTGATGPTGPAGAMVTQYYSVPRASASQLVVGSSDFGLYVSCSTLVDGTALTPYPSVDLHAFYALPVWVAGGPWGSTPTEYTAPLFETRPILAPGTIQMAAATAGLAATVSAWHDESTCYFIATH